LFRFECSIVSLFIFSTTWIRALGNISSSNYEVPAVAHPGDDLFSFLAKNPEDFFTQKWDPKSKADWKCKITAGVQHITEPFSEKQNPDEIPAAALTRGLQEEVGGTSLVASRFRRQVCGESIKKFGNFCNGGDSWAVTDKSSNDVIAVKPADSETALLKALEDGTKIQKFREALDELNDSVGKALAKLHEAEPKEQEALKAFKNSKKNKPHYDAFETEKRSLIVEFLQSHGSSPFVRIHLEKADENIKLKWTVHVLILVPVDFGNGSKQDLLALPKPGDAKNYDEDVITNEPAEGASVL